MTSTRLSNYYLEVIYTLELLSERQKQHLVLYITPILSLATFINIYLLQAVWLFDIRKKCNKFNQCIYIEIWSYKLVNNMFKYNSL